jgi:preprotein translocase subunit SecG
VTIYGKNWKKSAHFEKKSSKQTLSEIFKFMVKLFFLIILTMSLLSCDEEMKPELDCKMENYFSRFEENIPDYDTSNAHFMENIIRLRYDRTFSHLVGKDCFPNRPDVRCVSGDFYIYNLLSDTISFIFWYTKKDGLSNS